MKLHLHLQLGSRLPELCIDRVGIEQVMMNLLQNAIHALSTCERERHVTVQTRLVESDSAPFLVVRVEDNGPGLLGRPLATLLEPFYSSKPHGMGMGLAICRSIVEAHAGTMSVDACEHGGACFVFGLPLRTEAGEP